jgi:Ca2+-binding RTX toxin-like protein
MDLYAMGKSDSSCGASSSSLGHSLRMRIHRSRSTVLRGTWLRRAMLTFAGVVALAATSREPAALGFTMSQLGGSVVVSTGPASDRVSVSRGADGSVTVAVEGQELEGSASGGCVWNAQDAALVCPAATSLDVRLGDGNDELAVMGDVAVTATGEGGDDRLAAGVRGSVLSGGGGNDNLIGGEGADRMDGGPGDDGLSGDVGDDTLDSGDGQDNLDGGVGNDTVRGGNGADALSGSVGDDLLDGGAGDDALSGDLGVNRSDGGTGNDRIQVTGSAGDAGLGGDGDDALDASEAKGGAALNGGGGADALVGSRFADALSGGDGDDSLAGGAGSDVLAGGAGTDRVSYQDAEGAASVTVGGGADDGGPGEGDDVQADVEDVEGSGNDDTLVAGPAGTVLRGGGGNDRLLGGTAPDRLVGDAGNDHLEGGPGKAADVFEGGDDDDTVSYAARTEPLAIHLATGVARSGARGERDGFADAIEILVAGPRADRITGMPGAAHEIASGAGNDLVLLRDRRLSHGAADRVRCGSGRDSVHADRLDEVATSCERALVRARLLRPDMAFGGARQRVVVRAAGRVARLRVGCDARTNGDCLTRVVLRDPVSGQVLARRTVRIAQGRTSLVGLRAVSRRRGRVLARRTRLLVVVRARDDAGRRSAARRIMRTRRG